MARGGREEPPAPFVPVRMRLPRHARSRPEERGAALMMAFFVLVILIVLLHQISFSTKTDARVQRNEQTLLNMETSIEAVLLQVYEDLKADAESDGASGGAGGGGLGDLGADMAASGAEAQGAAAGDSREDDWAHPQRTELNEIRLRILIQDENSKFNVLSILSEDELEAEQAFERLVSVIENSRKGTIAEIDSSRSREMALAIRNLMMRRKEARLPKANLLSDVDEDDEGGFLLSLRELVGLDRDLFPPDLFRDYRDEDGTVIHSLGTFLTVWSSMTTLDRLGEAADAPGSSPPPARAGGGGGNDGSEEGGDGPDQGQEEGSEGGDQATPPAGVPDAGGGAPEEVGPEINLNTAPLAVLAALVDSRELPYGFWDAVLEYRNTEREDVEENEDPPLDEFGEEILSLQTFSSVDDLSKVDGWDDIEPAVQGILRSYLGVRSGVFSIFVTARKPTGIDYEDFGPGTKEALLEEEEEGHGLVRTVRSVVWRRVRDDGDVEIVPIVRWEVMDYVPIEVVDYPDEDRY